MKDIEDYGLIEQVDLLPQHSLAPADLPAERRVGVTRPAAVFSAARRGTDRSCAGGPVSISYMYEFISVITYKMVKVCNSVMYCYILNYFKDHIACNYLLCYF